MNKTILIIIYCLLPILSNSQEVSPFYPAKIKINDPYNFTSQITYFDLNFISNNISEFLTYRLNMVVEKEDDSKMQHDGGIYSVTYIDRISLSGNEKIKFTYNVGLVNDIYTIKSLKITGSKERLISFFVEFWQTSIKINEQSFGKTNVQSLTGQDLVKYNVLKGVANITVENNTFKSINDFKIYFEKLKQNKLSSN